MMSLELPYEGIKSLSRELYASSSLIQSPFTLSFQTQDWGGRQWRYEIELATTQGIIAKRLSAFFSRLGGSVNSFQFKDPSIQNKDVVSVVLVNGANQTGNTLVTDGWSSNELIAGDFFSLNNGSSHNLYQLTEDVTNTSGSATLTFVPNLRVSPADNAVVEIKEPVITLNLMGSVPSNITAPVRYNFSFSAIEKL